jgi:HlyD family secretion protein
MRFLSILVLLTFILSCQKKIESVKPVRESITESVYASGTIKSVNQYQVFSAMSGTIAEVYVKEGEIVGEGTALFKIYNSTVSLNREQANLGVELADLKANESKLLDLKLAIDNARTKMQTDSIFLDRQRKLWNQNIGARVDLEQKELIYSNSKNNYESAILKYNELKRQLEFSSKQSRKNLQISESVEKEFIVKSQVKGKIFKLNKIKGELANPSIPLAVIGDSENYIIEMAIDEYDINRIKIGQKVFVNMDSRKDSVFEAKLSRIIPFMNERSKSFSAEALFDNNLNELYPNLSVEANILIQKKEKALTIPRKFLSDDNTVTKKNMEKVKVKTGLKDYQKIEILGGITENDELIIP